MLGATKLGNVKDDGAEGHGCPLPFPFQFACPPSRSEVGKGLRLHLTKAALQSSLDWDAACFSVASMSFGLSQEKERERSLGEDRGIAVNLLLTCAPCNKRLRESHSKLRTDGM